MIVRNTFRLMPVAVLAISLTMVHAQQRPGVPRPSGTRGAVARDAETRTPDGMHLTKAAPRSITFTPEREAAALTFVRANLPELLPVLEDLKIRQSAEYQRAICDFFWTSETLATIRQQDPKRYNLALQMWRLETQTHLLTSQLVRQPADAERLRAELEQTVQQLVDVQIETSAYDVERLESQVRRAQGRHQRLADRRDELVRERLDALSQAIEQSVSGKP
ncbi:MAG: hypothetical protein L0Z07_05850 [Planctomycetes bacterium]|nr:hypothetical protein [Planctomycetota bacterium]